MRLPILPEQLKKKLIEDSLATAEQFDRLVKEAERKNQNFLDLLSSELAIDPEYLSNFIAVVLGVGRAALDTKSIDESVVKLLPEDIARQRQAIAFGREPDGSISVALLDPSNLETIQYLTQYLKSRITPYLASRNDLNRGFSIYGFQSATDFKKIIEENVQATLRSKTKTEAEAAAELPIVAIVDNILSYAIAARASDIHIEILEEATLIRYRIDGILYEIMRIPKSVHPALVARFKLLAGLKIDEHFKPQDGRFRHTMVNQVVDIRVSIMPTFYGEKIEMRLLESTQKPLSLEELGMSEQVSKILSENLKKAYGMILTTGPTGSGKSTTLYALVNLLNRPDVNIVTVEDPIEYNMRYVNQSQINPQAGITFASGLRAILRQDPNIIMVGEIRDSETADIAVQAALTGHLLLSTLHTNDAPTAIPRLFDLGVMSFLVASVLNLIIAQRLVRRSCPLCIHSYAVDEGVKNVIEEQLKESGVIGDDAKAPTILYRAAGCAGCGFTGYRGRVGIYEVVEVNDKIKKIITQDKFDLQLLRTTVRESGLKSMFEDGLDKAQLGVTTIEEVLRVVRE